MDKDLEAKITRYVTALASAPDARVRAIMAVVLADRHHHIALARKDEIITMAKTVGPEIKGETWKDWSFRALEYLEKRIAEIEKSMESKE